MKRLNQPGNDLRSLPLKATIIGFFVSGKIIKNNWINCRYRPLTVKNISSIPILLLLIKKKK